MSLFSCYFVLYFNHFLSYPPEIDGQLYLDFLIEKFGENKIFLSSRSIRLVDCYFLLSWILHGDINFRGTKTAGHSQELL